MLSEKQIFLGPYTKKQIREILDSIRWSELGAPEYIENDLVTILCPEGHTPVIKETDYRYNNKFRKQQHKEYTCVCSICDTSIWYIGPWTQDKLGEIDSYRYLQYEPWKQVTFVPGDENDPKKVEINAS